LQVGDRLFGKSHADIVSLLTGPAGQVISLDVSSRGQRRIVDITLADYL
jgi:hypothetical protein